MHGAVWAELRTAAAGVDPGLTRLRLAAVGSASMVLAVLAMAGVRALTGQPVTLLIFAAVLAMISNLTVNEPDLPRRRATTALMLGPAVVAVAVGTLLSPHRVVADVVFVGVTVAAVYVRRYGPRGFALGMAGFMPYFFTQFLQARPAELPWLLVAAGTGVGATLLLRGYVLPERDERTLSRLLRAFRARVHGVVVAVAGLLAAAGGPADRVERARREARRRRARLNTTALLVADRLDRLTADGGQPAAVARAEALEQRMLDVELAAERLAIATRRLAEVGGPRGDDRDVLLDGLRGLGAATATGTPHAMVPTLLGEARRAVAPLTARTRGPEERTQRVAFAVHRLADTVEEAAAAPPDGGGSAGSGPDGTASGGSGPDGTASGGSGPDGTVPHDTAPKDRPPDPITPDAAPQDPVPGGRAAAGAGGPPGAAPGRAAPALRLTTRQALQAGVAVGLSIVVGELVSPARWYWAAIAAFVVFAQTSSRGDVLTRGGQRVLGTVGGVAAGMGLAVVVDGRPVLAVAALVACLFLALYLVRISQALMAFWITAVLALMYGLIGQFSVATLVLRIEETAAGALMGVLAAFVVLPRRTHDAYDEAHDELVDGVDAVLGAATDRLLGREPADEPVELARAADTALGTLRERTAPLTGPWRRATAGYRDTLHLLAGVDHYARALARRSDGVAAPGWAPLLEPAVARVRADLVALRRRPGGPPAHHDLRDAAPAAEELVDAAEAWAARRTDAHQRHELLEVSRLLRRIDQSALTLRRTPAAADPPEGRDRGAGTFRSPVTRR